MFSFFSGSPYAEPSGKATAAALAMPPPLTPPPQKKSKLSMKKKKKLDEKKSDVFEMDTSESKANVEVSSTPEADQSDPIAQDEPKGEKEKNSIPEQVDNETLHAIQVISYITLPEQMKLYFFFLSERQGFT